MNSREEKIKQLANEIAKIIEANLRHCTNCNQFGDDEVCIKFGARPPAKIIAKSCEHWEFRENIPF